MYIASKCAGLSLWYDPNGALHNLQGCETGRETDHARAQVARAHCGDREGRCDEGEGVVETATCRQGREREQNKRMIRQA